MPLQRQSSPAEKSYIAQRELHNIATQTSGASTEQAHDFDPSAVIMNRHRAEPTVVTEHELVNVESVEIHTPQQSNEAATTLDLAAELLQRQLIEYESVASLPEAALDVIAPMQELAFVPPEKPGAVATVPEGQTTDIAEIFSEPEQSRVLPFYMAEGDIPSGDQAAATQEHSGLPQYESVIELITEFTNVLDQDSGEKPIIVPLAEQLDTLPSFESVDELLQFAYGVNLGLEAGDDAPEAEIILHADVKTETISVGETVDSNETEQTPSMIDQLRTFAVGSELLDENSKDLVEHLMVEIEEISKLVASQLYAAEQGIDSTGQEAVTMEIIMKRVQTLTIEMLAELGIPADQAVVKRLMNTFIKEAYAQVAEQATQTTLEGLQYQGTHEYKLNQWFDDFVAKIYAGGAHIDSVLHPAHWAGQLAVRA